MNVLKSVKRCVGIDRRGFTLVEMLVVIAIIALLMGLAIPAVQMAREASRRMQCGNRMRQMALANLNFESQRSRFPAGIVDPGSPQYPSSTWLRHLLPFVEQGNLWDRSQLDHLRDPSPFLSHLGMRTVVPLFTCPSDPSAGEVYFTHYNYAVTHTNFLGVNGTTYLAQDGIFYLNSKTRSAEIKDGLSNTLLIGERPPSPDYWYGWWYAGSGQAFSGSPDMLLGVAEINSTPPAGTTTFLEACPPGPFRYLKGEQQQCDTLHFWSHHPVGANFSMADGTIHVQSYDIDPAVMIALSTRASAEVVSQP